jgi:hypothetical protein
VTPEEATKLSHAQTVSGLLIVMTLFGIHFTQRDSKRSSQAKLSNEKTKTGG